MRLVQCSNVRYLLSGGLEELELLLQSEREALRVQERDRLLVHVGAQVLRAIAQNVALALELVALLCAQLNAEVIE